MNIHLDMFLAPFRRFSSSVILVVLIAVLASPAAGSREDDRHIATETKYAGSLIQLGFPDFARKVTDALGRTIGPGGSAVVARFELKALILERKLEEAQVLIDNLDMSDFLSWQTLLEGAEAYFALGMWQKTQKIYDDFFDAYPNPPADNKIYYKDQAYKYAQMLKRVRQDEAAIKAYERCLGVDLLTTEEQLQIWTETAQLAVKVAGNSEGTKRNEHMAKARKYAEQVQWQGAMGGIWFGKSVVIFAQLELLVGKRQEAMKLINGYLPSLQEAHEWLVKQNDPVLLKLTPMAECRYFLGTLYQEEGMARIEAGKKKEGLALLNEGLQHLYNVFARFSRTAWAAEAGKRTEEIFDCFDKHKVKYKRPDASKLREVIKIQLSEARLLMLGNDHEAAIEKYSGILVLFPEYRGVSISALSDLAKCYLATDQRDYARVVAGYVADRFCKNPALMEDAGSMLLSMAISRRDANDLEMANELYSAVITRFADHPKRTVIVKYLGDMERQEGNFDAAMAYYSKIKPEDEGYTASLGSVAMVWKEKKEYAKETEALKTYRKTLEPGLAHARATYRLAASYMNVGSSVNAVRQYNAVIKELEGPDSALKFHEREKSKSLMESARFNMGVACSKIKEPEVPADKVVRYQKLAVSMFGKFVGEFPDSKGAPGALLRMGVLQVIMGDNAGATESFDTLKNRYGDTDEARSMYFVRFKALVEMGYIRQARNAVEGMLKNTDQYTAGQFMVAGDLLGQQRESALSTKCYQQAMALVKDPVASRWIIEGSLYKLATYALKGRDYAAAVSALEELFKKYPSTGHTIECSFMLATAYAEIGAEEEDMLARKELFSKAMGALKAVAKLKNSPSFKKQADELGARISMASADISELRVRAEQSFNNDAKADENRGLANAAYFRVFQLTNPDILTVRPYMEEAFKRLIPYEMSAKRYEDAIEYCDTYLELFPEGKYREQAEKWLTEIRETVQALAGTPAPEAPAAPAAEGDGG